MRRCAPAGAQRAALALAAVLGGLALVPEAGSEPCPAPAAGADREEVACHGGAPLPDRARLLFGLRIDPNHADPWTIEALPGIGPALAAAWIRERERASFCDPGDLDRVPGIGPKRVSGLVPWLEVAADPACRGRGEGPPAVGR